MPSAAKKPTPAPVPVSSGVSKEQVQELVAEVVDKKLDALLAKLEPMLSGMTTRAGEAEEAAGKAEKALAAQTAQHAHALALRDAAAQADRDKRAAALAAVEQKSLETALPSATVAPDAAFRPRGGEERKVLRVEELKRSGLGRGALTEDQFARFEQALALGSQVSPSPSGAGVTGVGVGPRSAANLFSMFQKEGLAEVEGPAAAQKMVLDVFKAHAKKEAKKATKPSSYKEFYESIVKMGKLTRESMESDPDSYWQVLWLKDSVEWLSIKYGWTVAQEYYERVTELWAKGFIDLNAHVDTEDCRRGYVEGALHLPSYQAALRFWTPATSSSSARGAQHGSRTRVNPDDTWCGWKTHKKYYPKSKNHWWDPVKGEGTCGCALAAQ